MRTQRPKFEAALATSRAKADINKALAKMDEREEVLDLVQGYRALKAQLGLMDFSDQIALAAELARTQPEVGRLERAKYRVVLLDEYQDTSVAQAELLSTLFSGADAASGRGHAVTAVGDPNQAIYGWRGASVSNILGFGSTFPSVGRRRGSVVLPDGEPAFGLRILDVANAWPSRCTTGPTRCSDCSRRTARNRGCAMRSCTRPITTSWAGWPSRWRPVTPRCPSRCGARWACSPATTATLPMLRRPHLARIPVEIVGLKGLMRLPEVSEVVSTLALLQDLTANADLLNLLNGPRWAIGPRDLALLGERARALTGLKLREDGISVADELHAPSREPTRPRCCR